MAEHAHVRHSRKQPVRWASIVMFLAAAGVTAAVLWPLVHRHLAGDAGQSSDSAPPVQRLSPLRAQMAAARTVTGLSAVTVQGSTVWVARDANHGLMWLLHYSADKLTVHGAAIRIGRTASAQLAASSAGVYVRTDAHLEQLRGHRLVRVRASAVSETALQQLYGVAGLGQSWSVAGGRLYRQGPASAKPVKVGLAFRAAAMQPAIANGVLWLGRTSGSGADEVASIQPVTRTGEAAGPSVRLGAGTPTVAVYAADRLWVAVSRPKLPSLLYQINPANGRMVRVSPLPANFRPVAGVASGSSLWMIESPARGRIVRLALVPVVR